MGEPSGSSWNPWNWFSSGNSYRPTAPNSNGVGDFGSLSTNQLMGQVGSQDPLLALPKPAAAPNVADSWGGFGPNLDTARLGIGALGTLGNLYTSINALGLANKQFAFTRDTTNTNLANQIKSYNTALADRATARGVTQGQSSGAVADYIAKNSLSR